VSNEWSLVNRTTGEVREFAEYQQARANQSQGLAKRSEGRKYVFTFTDMNNIAAVINMIDEKHCGHLLYLQCFISFDGVLTNADKSSMTKADVQKALGLGRTAFYKFYRDMANNDIIREQADGTYAVNQAYHFRGSTDNPNVIKSFTTKVRELYNEQNAKKLGFIYKLLPYIHFETNTICANPFEKDMAKVEQLSKARIAKLTGVSEKTVYTYLRRLKLGDEFVFAEIRRGNERYYKINPFIFYRKNGRPDATLREIFRLGFN
jgi:hypothetical protein